LGEQKAKRSEKRNQRELFKDRLAKEEKYSGKVGGSGRIKGAKRSVRRLADTEEGR